MEGDLTPLDDNLEVKANQYIDTSFCKTSLNNNERIFIHFHKLKLKCIKYSQPLFLAVLFQY